MKTIKSIIIVLMCVVLLALEFFHKPQPELDIVSHRARCKMKIVQNRLAQFDSEIIKLARLVTAFEINYRVRAREIEAAPAPEFIPPSYSPSILPTLFVSATPCKSVAKGVF